MGGLKVQGEYPPEITFAPCPTSSARATGRFGFDVRHNGLKGTDAFFAKGDRRIFQDAPRRIQENASVPLNDQALRARPYWT